MSWKQKEWIPGAKVRAKGKDLHRGYEVGKIYTLKENYEFYGKKFYWTTEEVPIYGIIQEYEMDLI